MAADNQIIEVPIQQVPTDAPSMFYGATPKRLDNRLWRLERGNVMLRAGVSVSNNAPAGSPGVYGRTVVTALDNGDIDPTTSGLLKKGSIPPSVSSPDFTFTANSPTQLIISWPDYAIRRADNTATLLVADRIQIDNLTGNTLYYFYPYWSEAHAAIAWVTGGSGIPCIAFTDLNALNLQTQNLAGNISFGAISFTTPAAGTSSGTSGGFGGGTAGGGGGTSSSGTGGGSKSRLAVL